MVDGARPSLREGSDDEAREVTLRCTGSSTLSLPDHRALIAMIRDLWVSQESLLCIATSAYNAL